MGHGVKLSQAQKLVKIFFNKFKIPFVVTWNADDIINSNHKMYCGRPGAFGERGSNFIVQKVMTWTSKLSCHLMTVLHQNFGSDKPTGNLGSALEKKAETQIKLEKNEVNKGWITVECKRSRNRGFEPFSFKVNDKGLPEFVNNDFEF